MWWSCLVCKVPGSLAQHMLWGEVGGSFTYNLVRYQGVWRSTCCGGRSVDVTYIGWGGGLMKCFWFFVILSILCFLFLFNVIKHFESPAFTFRDWSVTRVRTHYMVHGSALLVIFSSLSSRLEFEIPAHSYFVSSFDTAPATIFKLKKNRSCYSCNKQYPKTPNFTSGSHH